MNTLLSPASPSGTPGDQAGDSPRQVSLASLSAPLATPAEMARWDREAAAFGIPPEMLMENASREALHALVETFGDVAGKSILLFAGPGANGGDAFCLARHLLDLGARVMLHHTRPSAAYAGESALHLRLASKAGVPMQHVNLPWSDATPGPEPRPDVIVDGLLGTGLEGEVKEPLASVIRWINARRDRAFIFSIDIPSGLDGLLGLPRPLAVRAHATVTFAAPKIGLLLPQAARHVGNLLVRPIGIPLSVRREYPPRQRLLQPALGALLPQPDPALHKGLAGHVCIVGGSPGLSGAVALAALGALRAGAGLVTVACPRDLVPEIKAQLPEAMCLGLGACASWKEDCLDALTAQLPRFDALVLGPGMGRDRDAASLVTHLLAQPDRPPTVWDADALYWLSKHPELLDKIPSRDVLTPHPGELRRLMEACGLEWKEDRFENARRMSWRSSAVLAAKDAGTVVVSKDNPAYYCHLFAPCLATGGSGDVLAGCLGTLLGQGLPSLEAACLAVLLHAMAGKHLERDHPCRGNLARDIANALPQAMAAASCQRNDRLC